MAYWPRTPSAAKATHPRKFSDCAEIECCQKDHGVNRDQDRDCDQKSEQELKCRSGIFQRFAGDLGVRPEESANVGRQPEPVDSERNRQQDRPANEQPPIGSALPEESHAAARCDPACIEGGHGLSRDTGWRNRKQRRFRNGLRQWRCALVQLAGAIVRIAAICRTGGAITGDHAISPWHCRAMGIPRQ